VPKQSGRKGPAGIRQAQGCCKLAKIPQIDEGVERPEGQVVDIRHGLLRSPYTEDTSKFEAKWIGP
jgi:hypothetical protein